MNMLNDRMYRLIRIPLFVGQINIKHKRNSLFSERNGYTPSITIGPIRLTWRRWEKPVDRP